ncbi:sugar ABC transporter permease [Chelativorans sp. M5D2P16]|uniref:carbohydrate ABC transporter permease n=1 Tax=Chelativorans sp. M5D2P16 TaxID=3095678 RepID=UPI002ACA2C6B|nr:sugar ABC transporter permease [Chelativorans sp. M5D2P16]MDZ5700132.1 sugar ABC transporter permease [Chelativorans sp. M5D2P16]
MSSGLLRTSRVMISDHPLPWLLPLLAILLVLAVYPFFYNIWLSFHEFVPRSRGIEPVGWENWQILFNDPRLWNALWVTLFYTAVCLAIQLVLGMGIALLIDSDEPGYAFIRGVLTLTLVIPPAITAMMFLLMEDAQFGMVPYALRVIGLFASNQTILASPQLAIWGVILADIWQWTPFMVLIFVAGLRSLPRDPFESAMIDGASSWQMFTRLTLPMMGKVIAIAVLIRGIDLFRMFDYVYVMTSGGPGTATYTLSLYAWQQTFSFIKWGYGATISLFSLFIILVVANLFVISTRLRW